MRILMLHNRYLQRGGEEGCFEAETRMLRDAGHVVEPIEEDNERVAELGAARVGLRSIWSTESYRQVSKLLRDDAYDVVHVHNFFPLFSPSVYYAARAANVPVVQALHNYRLSCVNGFMFRDGHVCEDCLGKVPWRGVLRGCYRDSRTASGAVASMVVSHRIRRTWTELVDAYICPSKVTRDKAIAGGLPPDRLIVKPHFVAPDPGPGEGDGGFMLYVGRLSPEKGLATLLSAWEDTNVRYPLKVVGDGPDSHLVQAACGRHRNIEWLGELPAKEVYDLMGRAAALVVPSEWHEIFGRIVIEAYAKGTPVIASNIGALAELVEDGKTGFLFDAGNVGSLVDCLKKAVAGADILRGQRPAARAEFESKYTEHANYQAMMSIYERVIAR